MSPHPPGTFQVAARLALASTVLMFVLIVIGSVVRTTGSGLACPDWPLCHGRLLPPLQFNVFIEWFHRLVALLVSVLLALTVGWTAMRAEVRARLGGLAMLATGLLAVQVLLGALTVWKLLSPAVVTAHLATALLLFVTLLTLVLVASAEAGGASRHPTRPAGLLPVLGVVTAMVYGQILLGGVVSTNGASLACPDWPTCGGQWLPPLDGIVGLQVLHRLGAYVLTLAMGLVLLVTRAAPDAHIRTGGRWAMGLTLLQVAVGVGNVMMRVPTWMSALHLGVAASILATLVVLTHRAARLPARALHVVPVEAR